MARLYPAASSHCRGESRGDSQAYVIIIIIIIIGGDSRWLVYIHPLRATAAGSVEVTLKHTSSSSSSVVTLFRAQIPCYGYGPRGAASWRHAWKQVARKVLPARAARSVAIICAAKRSCKFTGSHGLALPSELLPALGTMAVTSSSEEQRPGGPSDSESVMSGRLR